MKKDIPKGMIYVSDRTIMKQGSSLVVSIPRNVLKGVDADRGDKAVLYTNGKGQLLIDLKPDEE